MGDDIAALRQQIEQYEAQIELAAAATSEGPDQENLISLRADLEELITLTKENLSTLENKARSSQEPADDFDKEYALFKAELQEVEGNSSQTEASTSATSESNHIKSDLESIRGMKCQAPHRLPWGEIGFHNALVFGPESSDDDINCLDDIKVRVMFTNPMHTNMLPCPYYLEGNCRFSEAQCRYSHGDVVRLTQLRDYKHPNFSAVQPGVHVLVQQDDKLWHKGVIVSCGQNKCEVKLEKSGKQKGVDLQHILPLDDDEDEDDEDTGDESSSGSSSDSDAEKVSAELVEKSLLTTPTSTALGDWEKHTKGIGSRLMAQMGYVTGTGLGKNGEGRIEPVEVMVFPTGRSLDHCMQLRELSGGDEDLFKVEKRLKRLQQKHQQQSERQYEREKQKTNLFDFINSKLGNKSEKNQSTSNNTDNTLKGETYRGLNIVTVKVDDKIRRAEKDLARLRESLSRQATGSASHSAFSSKVEEKQAELATLRASEVNIDMERRRRKDRVKTFIF